MKFSRIKIEQRPLLLNEIHNILTEVGAHNVKIYNKAYWDWQYTKLPLGKSFVYVAWDKGKIVGYYHVPVYRCSIDGEEKILGNIQDVAVNSSYRGVGLFRQLADFANKDLNNSDVDLIYTFPNKDSIRTFTKYNDFKWIATVPTYIRPVKSTNIISSKIKFLGIEKILGAIADGFFSIYSKVNELPLAKIEVIDSISDEIEKVFKDYSKLFKNHLIRDKAWLTWRYSDSIRGKHHILTVRENSHLTAVLILKEDQMFNNPTLLIMDFAYVRGHESGLRYLLKRLIKEPGLIDFEFNLIFTSTISELDGLLKKVGFIKIPARLNPRVLNFLGRSSGGLSEKLCLEEKDWLLTLGDWDVF